MGAVDLAVTAVGQPGYSKGVPKSPEHRAKIAAAMKGKRKSPEHVAKMSEALKGKPNLACLGVPLTEEHRAKLSEAHRGKTLSAEHRAKIAATLTALPRVDQPVIRYGWWSIFGEFLRDQDGDLCQLCLEPIDFNLRWPNLWSRSVDHILPLLVGGTNSLDNLWLAHLTCNMKKGARHVGREDGSTNARSS